MDVDIEEDINEFNEFNDIDALNDFCVDDTTNNDDINRTKPTDFTPEIATLVSAIGIIDDSGHKIFIRGEYCSSAIARLEYLLRSEYIKNRHTKDFDDDTDNNEIFNKCGEFMVMSKKLVPCFKQCMQDIIKYGLQHDKSKPLLRMVQCLIKMFTRFTFPLTYNINNTVDNYVNYSKYQHFLEYQQTFKKCLIDNTVLMQIIILMGDCSIDLDPDERSEMDIDLLELYLCLLRNILSIPNRIEYDDFLHDRTILAFKEEQVMDVLVELSTNIYEECEKIQFLLMDIFFQFFKMEDADSMIMVQKTHNNNSSLYKQYKKEKLHRKSVQKRRRHKNFGGISRVGMMNGQSRIQSLGSSAMCNDNMFDRRRQKKFRPVKEKKKRMYLNDTVKHSLMYVADLLLEKSFTPLVNTMYFLLSKKMEFEINQSQHCKKWLKLVSVFLKYHRLKTRSDAQKKAKRDGVAFLNLKWYSSSWISCVLQENVVNFIISRINTLFEDRSNKHMRCESHFNRLEETLSCYKEIIRSIYSMMKYGNEVNDSNGMKLFTYIFEDNRGPELIHNMINEYKVHQSTKVCLSYCIEAVYYTDCILQIMRHDGQSISVKTKTKKKRKKSKKNNVNTGSMEVDGEEQELEHEEEKHIVEVAGMEIHDDTDDDDDEMMYNRREFDYEKFMKSYASNKVIAQYMYILEDYATNSAKLNSYIVILFNTLAFKMDYAPLLFQLKYFILFDKILHDKVIIKDKNFNIVRKFCTNIVCNFFKRSKENKVLFSEILFHKTPHALSDINEPGTVYKHLQNKRERESRRKDRIDIEGDLDDNDFDDEEEYQELNINMTQWTDDEDNLLRNYYSTYAQQANVLNILQDFLENELEKTRSQSQIDDRLRGLGLRTERRNKRKNHQNEAKKRIKPKEMDIDEKKSIIYHCIHRACYVSKLQRNNNENEEKKDENNEDDANRNVFTWLCNKLDNLCDIVCEVISASSDILLDDIAIIPVELNEFNSMNNLYLIDLLKKLGFLSPNKYIGTLWWRIPREFKITEIQNMINLMKDALELPMDANLNDLCVAKEQSMDDIALLNNNNLDNNPFSLAAIESENEIENDNKEQSGSEEEYQVAEISEMENNSTQNQNQDILEDNDENIERKKKKKEKKEKKKKRKKDKKKKRKKDKKKKKKDKKKKKKKHKSRKRKRDKITKEDGEGSEDNDGEKGRKRRRLNVNKNNNNEEDSFFNDIASDMEEDNDNDNGNDNNVETEMKTVQNMNTPQIQKFQGLTLFENNNTLNVVKENESEDDDDDIIPKRRVTRKSKRAFVSDSDSD